MPSPSDQESDGREVRLPAHGTTVVAEDLRVRLVLAADTNDDILVDASEAESVGQAVLQLLLAARQEATERGQSFTIANPSPAFIQRIAACGLAETFGLETEEVQVQ